MLCLLYNIVSHFFDLSLEIYKPVLDSSAQLSPCLELYFDCALSVRDVVSNRQLLDGNKLQRESRLKQIVLNVPIYARIYNSRKLVEFFKFKLISKGWSSLLFPRSFYWNSVDLLVQLSRLSLFIFEGAHQFTGLGRVSRWSVSCCTFWLKSKTAERWIFVLRTHPGWREDRTRRYYSSQREVPLPSELSSVRPTRDAAPVCVVWLWVWIFLGKYSFSAQWISFLSSLLARRHIRGPSQQSS